jgi:hypothetical protein
MTSAAAPTELPSLDDSGILTQEAINACAEFVRNASDRDLEAAMTAEGGRVLELVLAGMRSSYVGAPHIRAEIVWTLLMEGRPQSQFVTLLSDGDCTLLSETPAAARLTLTMESVIFLRIVTGGVSPLKLFATGQLKTQGDLTFAAQLTKLFRFPDSSRTRFGRRRRTATANGSEHGAPGAGSDAPASTWFGGRRA